MSVMKKTLTTLLLAVTPMLVMAAQGEVNVNTANKQQLLDSLDNLSPEQADAIIKHREKNGPFTNIHEVGTLSEVGWDVLNINQDRITVGDTSWGDKK